MTAPTPKPEESKSGFHIPRTVALGLAACVAFAVFAVSLIRVLPSPHGRADYLIVGTLSTLAALITIFAGMVMGRRKR